MDDFSVFENPSLMLTEGDPRFIDTIFNVTGLIDGFFNNSNNALVTYIGGVILFIVLVGPATIYDQKYIFHFLIAELALFFLDVYYNQTNFSKNLILTH